MIRSILSLYSRKLRHHVENPWFNLGISLLALLLAYGCIITAMEAGLSADWDFFLVIIAIAMVVAVVRFGMRSYQRFPENHARTEE